jgi:hypothetical protein
MGSIEDGYKKFIEGYLHQKTSPSIGQSTSVTHHTRWLYEHQRCRADGHQARSPGHARGGGGSHVNLWSFSLAACYDSEFRGRLTVSLRLPPQACVVLPSQGRLHSLSGTFSDRLESVWAHQHSLWWVSVCRFSVWLSLNHETYPSHLLANPLREFLLSQDR